MPALSVAEIAFTCGGTASGDTERVIRGANALETAGSEDLSFVSNAKAEETALHSHAGCLIVNSAFQAEGNWSLIRVAEPRAAFAQVLGRLYPPRRPAPVIHPTAVVAKSARLGSDCSVGPYAVIDENADIGSGCQIGSGVQIGAEVVIGRDSVLHAQVTLYPRVRLGERVVIHAGSVIGADGFGYAFAGDHYEKFPQVGTVAIEDDVEIGAQCCIDRAALGVTRIGRGSKLDNLVHIAHNCNIGQHVVIAAQTGFAGGVIIEDYAVLGGQVGIGEKAVVASRAVVGSGSGILSFAHVAAGEPVWGTPARPLRQYLKGLANVSKLADLKKAVRELSRRVDDLESHPSVGK